VQSADLSGVAVFLASADGDTSGQLPNMDDGNIMH
jgi:hypothetical protein